MQSMTGKTGPAAFRALRELAVMFNYVSFLKTSSPNRMEPRDRRQIIVVQRKPEPSSPPPRLLPLRKCVPERRQRHVRDPGLMPETSSNRDQHRCMTMVAHHVKPCSGPANELLGVSSRQILAAAGRLIASSIHGRESGRALQAVLRSESRVPLQALFQAVHPLVPSISKPRPPKIIDAIGKSASAIASQHAPS